MKELRIADGSLESEEEQRLSQFELRSVLQEWIDTGAATAAVYVLFAQLPSASESPSDDLKESVSALEQAVNLAPENGQYRYWLAQGYLSQGRIDEAIAQFNIARDSLPQNLGLTAEVVDSKIRRAEAERSQQR